MHANTDEHQISERNSTNNAKSSTLSEGNSATQNTQLIDYLIHHRGICSEFVDAWGKPATIKAENQHKLLSAMGYDLTDEALLIEQLEDEIAQYWLQAIDPVSVSRVGEGVCIKVRTSIENASKVHSVKIKLESGEQSTFKFTPVDTCLINTQEMNDIEWHEYEIELPRIDTLGYHHIDLLSERKIIGRSSLIIAPQVCYIPKSISDGHKIWGLSVQLYCLRSHRNWGIGDFTDLTNLIFEAAKIGADFIGLNPIHALYPANPQMCSPYGPSSRSWLNYLYIDVQKVPGADSPDFAQWMQNNNIEKTLVELRATELVDYEGVAKVKHAALEKAFMLCKAENFKSDPTLKKAFNTFVKDGGDSLKILATFEAIQISLKNEGKEYWGWPVFPDNLQSSNMPDVEEFAKKHKDLVQFYMFLQWQATLQFEQASESAKTAAMEIGLYRDLAVGVSSGSAEIWGNQDLYCTDVSVGAPPDVLGPLGQKWGLPPMDPAQLVEQAYKPIIDLFSANMKASGALRIDHVMALLRLWWVHEDDDASEGAYVNYPLDDLLAILALESVRNKALVIGEDLGTVPDFIREKLQQNGMYSYRVFFFEQADDGGFFSPLHYPEQSMATLTTHDMPTLSGFWHCDDLSLGKELGLYRDPDVLAKLYHTRHANKQHILNTLHGHQSIGDTISCEVQNVGMTQQLNFGMQTHMAKGMSALLSLQLEDWLQMDKPVNVPGTSNEYPNWQRKLSHNLEDIFVKPNIQQLAEQLTLKRQQASKTIRRGN